MLELRGPAHIGQTPPPHVLGALPGAEGVMLLMLGFGSAMHCVIVDDDP